MELEVFDNEIAFQSTNIEIERNATKRVEVKFEESNLSKTFFEGNLNLKRPYLVMDFLQKQEYLELSVFKIKRNIV